MKNLKLAAILSLAMFGCGTADIGQTEKGQMYNSTGALAFYANSTGFVGPILSPGTYYTGIYGDVRTVFCGQITHKETLGALTKDGVKFNIDVYSRTEANCSSDDAVKAILQTISPAIADEKQGLNGKMVGNLQLYETFLRPVLGEAVRIIISNYNANDINSSREKIFTDIKMTFFKAVSAQQPQLIKVIEFTLNNMDFPDQLEQANVDRAQQAILKDTAIAEREKVKAETETALAKQDLEKMRAANEAVRIEAVGEALRRNPEYLAYQQLQMLPQIYKDAGIQGNMIITAPDPNIFAAPKSTLAK
jgi:hypothetical protein